jgi:hypothetical protein
MIENEDYDGLSSGRYEDAAAQLVRAFAAKGNPVDRPVAARNWQWGAAFVTPTRRGS